MARKRQADQYSVSQPISATLKDGSTVSGTLWLHASRVGSFEVEYQGRRHSDYRTDYTSTAHIRPIARQILREMAEKP